MRITFALFARGAAVAAGLAVGLALGLAATAALADSEAGKDEYLRRCAACHGADGAGAGPVAEQLKIAPANLVVLRSENGGVFPRDQIIAVIDGRDWLEAHGRRAMPVWGEIFEAIARDSLEGEFGNPEDTVIERIEDIVDYIETLQE